MTDDVSQQPSRDDKCNGESHNSTPTPMDGEPTRLAEPAFRQGRGLLRRWFDSVQSQLTMAAQQAGLFSNPSITGGAREEVVRKVLANLLPAWIEVGTGRVIGADSEPSRQIDVVIFDGRFPVLRMAPHALYPCEGVIATIEVKSDLDDSELRSSLDNCLSVMRISPSFVKEDADAWLAKRRTEGVTAQRAHEELVWHLSPRTYVFSLRGFRLRESQAKSLQEWLAQDRTPVRHWPVMPSVIVGDRVVTVALSDRCQVCVEDPETQRDIEAKGVAITIESTTGFGILVSHLLGQIAERALLIEPPSAIRRTVLPYLPFMEYIQDCIRNTEFSVTLYGTSVNPDLPRVSP